LKEQNAEFTEDTDKFIIKGTYAIKSAQITMKIKIQKLPDCSDIYCIHFTKYGGDTLTFIEAFQEIKANFEKFNLLD